MGYLADFKRENYRLKCWLNSVKEWLIGTSVKISVTELARVISYENRIHKKWSVVRLYYLWYRFHNNSAVGLPNARFSPLLLKVSCRTLAREKDRFRQMAYVTNLTFSEINFFPSPVTKYTIFFPTWLIRPAHYLRETRAQNCLFWMNAKALQFIARLIIAVNKIVYVLTASRAPRRSRIAKFSLAHSKPSAGGIGASVSQSHEELVAFQHAN